MNWRWWRRVQAFFTGRYGTNPYGFGQTYEERLRIHTSGTPMPEACLLYDHDFGWIWRDGDEDDPSSYGCRRGCFADDDYFEA